MNKSRVKRTNTYVDGFNNRQIARERLPKWLAALMPFVFLSCTFGITIAAVFIARAGYLAIHPGSQSPFIGNSLPLTQALLVFPSFLVGTASSISVSNILVWLIPPVRTILDQAADGVPGASFSESMKAGRKAIFYVAIPASLVIILGIWSPWMS